MRRDTSEKLSQTLLAKRFAGRDSGGFEIIKLDEGFFFLFGASAGSSFLLFYGLVYPIRCFI